MPKERDLLQILQPWSSEVLEPRVGEYANYLMTYQHLLSFHAVTDYEDCAKEHWPGATESASVCRLVVKELLDIVSVACSAIFSKSASGHEAEPVQDSLVSSILIDFASGGSSSSSSPSSLDDPIRAHLFHPQHQGRWPNLETFVRQTDSLALLNAVPSHEALHQGFLRSAGERERGKKTEQRRPGSEKKSYEVSTFAPLISSIVEPVTQSWVSVGGGEPQQDISSTDASGRAVVIDVGAGQGYLCMALEEKFRHVVAVERDSQQTEGAERKLQISRKREREEEDGSSRGVTAVCYADVGPFTTASTFAAAVHKTMEVGDESTTSSSSPTVFALCTLHACGSLSTDTLRLFAAWPEAKVVLNIGCCYNLIPSEGGHSCGAESDSEDDLPASKRNDVVKVKARPESVLAPQLGEQQVSVVSSSTEEGRCSHDQPQPLRTVNLPVSGMARNLFGESSQDVISMIFNRNLKMAACQAPRRWAQLSKKGQVATKPTQQVQPAPTKSSIDIGQWRFDRAVLWEALRLQGFGADERRRFSRLPQWLNAHGRRNAPAGQKEQQFAEQCVKAMEYVLEQRKIAKLETTPHPTDAAAGTDAPWSLERCAAFYRQHRITHYPKWACLWTLKCLAGQVAESFILLDRCLYVKEQYSLSGNESGGEKKSVGAGPPTEVKTYVIPALDHMKSPRNFAVLALKTPKEL